MLARIKLFDQLGFFFICMQNTAWSDRGQTSAIENGLRCPTISIYSQNNEKILFLIQEPRKSTGIILSVDD